MARFAILNMSAVEPDPPVGVGWLADRSDSGTTIANPGDRNSSRRYFR